MGAIYPPRTQFASRRQQQYFAAKAVTKTDRKQVVQRELQLQLEMCDWLRVILPVGVHFRSDTGAGAFNSEGEKHLHVRLQSTDSQPDVSIFLARRGYHGLVIELKAEGTNLRMMRDGTKIRIKRKRVKPTKKHPEGWKIIERDYKIRKKGDWSSLHVERQAAVLEDYRKQGYAAFFAVGETNFKKIVCWYVDKPYLEETAELF